MCASLEKVTHSPSDDHASAPFGRSSSRQLQGCAASNVVDPNVVDAVLIPDQSRQPIACGRKTDETIGSVLVHQGRDLAFFVPPADDSAVADGFARQIGQRPAFTERVACAAGVQNVFHDGNRVCGQFQRRDVKGSRV